MWLVARQNFLRLFPIDAAQQVVHRDSKQRIARHQTMVEESERMI